MPLCQILDRQYFSSSSRRSPSIWLVYYYDTGFAEDSGLDSTCSIFHKNCSHRFSSRSDNTETRHSTYWLRHSVIELTIHLSFAGNLEAVRNSISALPTALLPVPFGRMPQKISVDDLCLNEGSQLDCLLKNQVQPCLLEFGLSSIKKLVHQVFMLCELLPYGDFHLTSSVSQSPVYARIFYSPSNAY